MQVFDINGREFHIDDKGAVIDGISNAMYLPVANGFITTEMARKELLTIARFLQDNRFWNEQIEQIFFTAKKEVLLVPRIGNHTIELGCVNNLEKKLDKLRKFYQKGLNTVGWNKYKKINIEFDKQVICTKRDK
jgi:cell division protein FtsQ